MMSKEQSRYIAIEGNIGAGKTTLAKLLSRKWNATLYLEEFEKNDFLPKFYEDTKRYAFSVELSFLADRFHQLKKIVNEEGWVVSDYYIQKSLIFARHNLEPDEFELFYRLYDIMFEKLRKPDLLIYLDAGIDRIRKQITQRGRIYERQIPEEYLKGIHDEYMGYIKSQKSLPVLRIDVGQIDFVSDPEHFRLVSQAITTDYSPGLHDLSE